MFVAGGASRSFGVVLTGYVCYACSTVAIGGMTDALAVARVRAGAIYGRLRGWGSIGFICSAMTMGLLIQVTGADLTGPLVPAAMWFGLGGAFVAALRVGGTGEPAARPRFADVRALLRDPGMRLLLLAGGLHWMCMTPYNIFLGVYLRDRGLPPLSWGLAYAVGVVAEMVALLSFHRFHRRFRLDRCWRLRSSPARSAGWGHRWRGRRRP